MLVPDFMEGEMVLARLQREARRRVREVRDDPEGRYRMREAFYSNYGFPQGLGGYGFGSSELQFLRWEIERGVLNRPDDPKRPGSPWWRAVNEDFLYCAELAALARGSDLAWSQVPPRVMLWLRYLNNPCPASWYRAHNASIVQGYLDHAPRALEESRAEQMFMNIVLYRVLYAQSMVEGCAFSALGCVLANPCYPAVHLLLELPDFYPRNYPLQKQDIHDLMHKGHDLSDLMVDIFDDIFILPDLDGLYQEASGWNLIPDLTRMVAARRPIYPRLAPRAVKRRARVDLSGAVGPVRSMLRLLAQSLIFRNG
jgi:hypothetical protein